MWTHQTLSLSVILSGVGAHATTKSKDPEHAGRDYAAIGNSQQAKIPDRQSSSAFLCVVCG
jgi:hypothetical protein